LDVLAYIGWRHEHDQRQLVEIQRELNQKGIEINERNVGKLYRQYLALLGATSEAKRKKLDEIVEKHGGLILGVDALQPEGHGSLLYVLYEILSGTVVSAIQLEPPNEKDLTDWLKTYQSYPVLASVSDGEERIIAALRAFGQMRLVNVVRSISWAIWPMKCLKMTLNYGSRCVWIWVVCPKPKTYPIPALFFESNRSCGSREC
jgi:hypothetical protein